MRVYFRVWCVLFYATSNAKKLIPGQPTQLSYKKNFYRSITNVDTQSIARGRGATRV